MFLRIRRGQVDPQVEKWLDDADDEQLFFSVVSLGEIFKGLTILPESKRRGELQHWLDETLRPWVCRAHIAGERIHCRTLGDSRRGCQRKAARSMWLTV